MSFKIVILWIAVFGAGLYCSEFLIPKKIVRSSISNEQLIRRLELLMRIWSRVLTKLGSVQEYGIVTIAALLENDKTHPLVICKTNRQAFIDRVSTLTDRFSQIDHELQSFCTFLNNMKEETRSKITK